MQRKTLMQLFIPIAFETLFFMLAGMVDTLMLSSVGDAAVGAVGTANTYISIFIMMFNVVSAGMIAVMTQYIGAGREGVAYQAKQFCIKTSSPMWIHTDGEVINCGTTLSVTCLPDAIQIMVPPSKKP